ncbi:MAG: PAS domain-containing sensor histidine kinase [Anaeromyxobacter sp.]
MIHPADVAQLAAGVRQAVATGGLLECEFRVRRADGAYRWFLGRASPVRDAAGRVTGWMGIGTDIEDRRRAEQALRDADWRKDEFLGMLSHELRNPLAPLTSALYLMEQSDPASPRARRAREVVARQAAHLTRLVDDLLDVTRIVRGKIELRRERIDLGEVAARASEDHRAVLEARGVELVLERSPAPLPLDGDATRIAQIAGNLLQNAAKYTPPGGHVWVRVRRRAGRLELCVRDDGAGIAPELLPRLFEPFSQGPQGLARSEGGLGLGLAMVKGLAALHGGTAEAHSEGEGCGTEVVVTFAPAAPASAEEGWAAAAP